MSNLEKYQSAFVESLELSVDELAGATMETVDHWDSVGHMALIAVLEETFGIEFAPDDIVCLNSFEKGIALLKKYDIEI